MMCVVAVRAPVTKVLHYGTMMRQIQTLSSLKVCWLDHNRCKTCIIPVQMSQQSALLLLPFGLCFRHVGLWDCDSWPFDDFPRQVGKEQTAVKSEFQLSLLNFLGRMMIKFSRYGSAEILNVVLPSQTVVLCKINTIFRNTLLSSLLGGLVKALVFDFGCRWSTVSDNVSRRPEYCDVHCPLVVTVRNTALNRRISHTSSAPFLLAYYDGQL